MSDSKSELVLKLKEIFRSDQSDLDFGIYKILNHRRDEINQFIETGLVQKAEEEFGSLMRASSDTLIDELESLRLEINRDFGDGTILTTGEVVRNHDAPKIIQFQKLKLQLDDTSRIQSEINDVFNHVYEFFNRYYDRGDFISQRRFGGREKYFVPYNGEEVSLNWANQDQYYVKTSDDYSNYSFVHHGHNFEFRITHSDQNENSNRDDDRFLCLNRAKPIIIFSNDNLIHIYFEHRTLLESDYVFYNITKRTQKSSKIRQLVDKDSESIIEQLSAQLNSNHNYNIISKHLSTFYNKNTLDYFIHKNLGLFLKRELDFYLKNEVMILDEWIDSKLTNINIIRQKTRAIESLCLQIIELLDELENFQKKLFEKKKMILRTDYCITLDLIPLELYDEIGSNIRQVEEWKSLYNLVERSHGTLFPVRDTQTLASDQLINHKNLVVDTKYYSNEFKYRLLSYLDDIDNICSGLLIKSDNYHAINLIKTKYHNKLDCVYIDPPFNTGSDGFLYKDKYQHSSWLSMMYDRISETFDLLNEKGSLWCHIDDNEDYRLRFLLDKIFSMYNYNNKITWLRSSSGKTVSKNFANDLDYIFWYAKSDTYNYNPTFKPLSDTTKRMYNKNDNDGRGYYRLYPMQKTGNPGPETTYDYIDNNGKVWKCPAKGWRMRYSKMKDLENDDRLYLAGNRIGEKAYWDERENEGKIANNLWDDISNLQGSNKELIDFTTQKPEKLIHRIFSTSCSTNGIIADIFVGSGTSCSVAQKMGHPWIAVEIGDQFENIIINRLKKTLFGEKLGISNEVDYNGGGMFKYIYLEQYDDTINNISIRSKNGYIQTSLSDTTGHILKYILNSETDESPILLNIEGFKNPFEYKIIKLENKVQKETSLDLVETFNYLLGLNVQKVRRYINDDLEYVVIYGELPNSQERVMVIWRAFDESVLENEKYYIENEVIPELHTESNLSLTIFVNVDSYIQGAQSIFPVFKELTFS